MEDRKTGHLPSSIFNPRPSLVPKGIPTMSRIRVGLIRCDTHGLWFGPLMAEHDPLAFQRPMDPRHPHPYTWQAGGCHKFFYSDYADPTRMTVPFVGGFEITRLWDEHRDAAEQAKAVFHGKPKVCDSFEQCSEDVDLVFISDCNLDGSDHLKLARPGLERGIPTFVDKPFADTVAHARELLDLARKHNAPIFSLSIVRTEPAVARFKNRIPEAGKVNFATISGYGTHPAGFVHTTSATQHLFGSGIQTVDVLTAREQVLVHLDYGGERAGKDSVPLHGVTIHTNVGSRPLTALGMSIYGDKTDIHETMLGDFVYADGTAEIIKLIKQMVETRESPEKLMNEVVESIAVIEAFKMAQKTRQPAKVADFL